MSDRRTNETRTREMRTRLLEATIDCLIDSGYAGTSTTLICKRAGVSRGAQVHHFPHKQDLLVAAVEHVFELRRAGLRAVLEAIEPGDERIEEGFDRLWATIDGAATEAWLELVVASRTDEVLRDKVVAATERLRVAGAEELSRLGEAAELPQAAFRLALAVMDGLVVQQLAGLPTHSRVEVLSLLKTLVLRSGDAR